jgi:hypothetical protein
MPSIQDSADPLVFRVADRSALPLQAPVSRDGLPGWRTAARALDGMQKEALVAGPDGGAWRMVCDEGPYLNGTDLAPFPLAYFSAGMAAETLSGVLLQAEAAGRDAAGATLVQDNHYSMEGSALRGTMLGGALPVEAELSCPGIDEAALRAMLDAALQASPACALLREDLANRFALWLNGAPMPLETLRAVDGSDADDPVGWFDQAVPAAGWDRRDLIVKERSAESVEGVEGGAGSSLQADQKRRLHVRAVATVRPEGLIGIEIHLFKPIGSVFRFLAEPTASGDDDARAPRGLDYLSAGLAFCFMTQIGRYAHITKRALKSYRVVQDTFFGRSDDRAGTGLAGPVDTITFLEGPIDAETAETITRMSERTCFLHAACRTRLTTRPRIAAAPARRAAAG